MSNLVIVESPAKAKTIKKYLGSSYKVVASMGHIRDLPKSQLGIDIENNFEPKYISIRGKSDLIKNLKKEAKGCKKIFLATDPDREGEAISWHLAQLLGVDPASESRVIFNEITKGAVQAGIKHPRAVDMNLVDAQQARRVLDRLVGYQISPFLWRKIKKGLSAGRVQSVATKLIVDREHEIEAFESKEYWTVEANLRKEKNKFTAKFYGDINGKIEPSTEEEATVITDYAKQADFSVVSVKKSEKKRHPAPPFITSTLQQDASRKLSMAAKRTMQIAQELYEGIEISGQGLVGLITYMRTDSLRVSQEAIVDVREYVKQHFDTSYLPKSPRTYRAKKGAQDAHEAIRPTMVSLTPDSIKKNLSRDQFRLYELIWKRFVASQMESQVLDTVAADISCGKNGETKYLFRATGSTVKFPGFTTLYEEGKDEKEEESEGKLPNLADGDQLQFVSVEGSQHFTQPPARYTEATLIRALEENGIGRPSTYAPTITTIQQREYVAKEGKVFKPTALGNVTTELMVGHFPSIVDIAFTANMENSLDHVETGEIKWKKVIADFYGDFAENMKKAEEELEGVHLKVPDEETDEVCEVCGRNMVIKSGRYGKFLACPGYPDCKNTKAIVVDTGALCPKCGGRIVQKKSKNGNKYYGCEHNPTCDFMTWYEPTSEKCPVCGTVMLRKNSWKKELICAKEGCGYQTTPEKKETKEQNS